MTKRLFHLMPDAEWKRRQKAKQTWGQIERKYRQPQWCAYPDALDGVMGCWSLTGRMIKSETDCAGCEMHKPDRKALKAK